MSIVVVPVFHGHDCINVYVFVAGYVKFKEVDDEIFDDDNESMDEGMDY